jgi:hypothetical protein
MNVYSSEFDLLYRILTTKSAVGVAGDFKAFDKRHRSQVLRKIVKRINDWYDARVGVDENANRIRTALWAEVYNSRNIIHKDVYEWDGSLPSGHPGTTAINNIVNHIYFRYAWVCAHEHSISSLTKFDECVKLVTGGDDNILCLNAHAQEVFNQHRLTEIFLKEMQLTYTAEDKSTNPAALRPVKDLTFLKRAFRYEKRVARYIGALDINTIMEMPYWTKKGPLEHQIPETKFTQAIHELSQHGEEVYNKLAPPMIIKSRYLMDFVPPFTQWAHCLDEVQLWNSDHTVKPSPGMHLNYGKNLEYSTKADLVPCHVKFPTGLEPLELDDGEE